MKKVLLSVLAIVAVVFSAVSQNTAINIVRLTMDPLDQAAKLHPKTDINGDLYALIKVRPACDNLKFSFGLMKCIPDNVPHENETWLYVQKNARRISISGEGYDPVMNADLGLTIEAGMTYVIELKANKAELPDIIGGNKKVFKVNGVQFTMIPVDGGTFQMGATEEQGSDAYSDEKPVHRVTLSSYMIGETEVTQALWQAVMGSNPSYFEGDDLPVEKVSWKDCQTFIRKLNELTGEHFRLPTEAEWEYAARGGNRSSHTKHSGSNNIGEVAWYKDNSSSRTHEVKGKQPNELGLYDMSGNVWEWCQDKYGDYRSGTQTNSIGSFSGSDRVLRGGSWDSIARSCRVSSRFSYPPDYNYDSLGLRLAL